MGEKLCRAFAGFPDAQELDEEVLGEARVQHLADQENLGGKSRLKHDGHVRGVEKTDRVRATHPPLTGRFDWYFNAESLKVDDGREDDERGKEVHDVWKILSVESFIESTLLVRPCQEKVEKCDNSTLELRSSASVDGRWGESLPDDRFAYVGSNEERDTTSQTISFLKKLIQKDDNKPSHNQLHY